MTIAEWLKESEKLLKVAEIPTARLDTLILLEDQIMQSRAWVLSHPEHILQRSDLKILNTKIVQRSNHTPLAYIRGHVEFYGRDFIVSHHTLTPRPETETIIELLKSLNPVPNTRILDLGTGTGCLAITAALELPTLKVSASDIDKDALRIARKNANRLGAEISFRVSDLLGNTESADIIITNLPYVPDNFQINTAATFEPRHAIFSGSDGLDLYRKMFKQLSIAPHKPMYVLTESLPISHDELAKIAKAVDYHLVTTDDFVQVFKCD